MQPVRTLTDKILDILNMIILLNGIVAVLTSTLKLSVSNRMLFWMCHVHIYSLGLF